MSDEKFEHRLTRFFGKVNWTAVLIWLILMATVLAAMWIGRDNYVIEGVVVNDSGENLVLQDVEIDGWNLDEVQEKENGLVMKRIKIESSWRATRIFIMPIQKVPEGGVENWRTD